MFWVRRSAGFYSICKSPSSSTLADFTTHTSISAFYGLGMGSPRTLAKLWTFYPPGNPPLIPVKSWNSNPAKPNATIYQVLKDDATQNLITVCIGSVLGSILLIMVINHVPRKQFLMWSFIWLAALFAITGGSFFSVFHTDLHAVSIVLIALCHFSFNLGEPSPTIDQNTKS
jgi:PHS family inorganic phosphate transporter-like MFS transporter